VLLFAGSNYLDLAHHPEVVEASARAARDHGCAAGGSRLITGNLAIHEALEAELADFLGRETALVFNTGYMANLGVIPALAGELAVVKERLDTHERLAAAGQVATPEAIEGYESDDAVDDARELWRQRFLSRVFRVLELDAQAPSGPQSQDEFDTVVEHFAKPAR